MKQLLLIVLLLLANFSSAQENTPTNFSLQEAIDYALTYNRTAINAGRDINAAKKQKWETIATGLPQINANVNYQNFLKQQVTVLPAEIIGGKPGEFAEVIFGTKQNAKGSVTLSQQIFNGSYIIGVQSTKVFLEISKNAKEKTDLEVRKAVINAYTNVLLAKESISILKNNIAILDKNLSDITKIYENGFEEEESVEQLKITLSGIKNELNKAERLKLISVQMLNITLGIEYDNATILTDSLEQLTVKNTAITSNNSTNIENNIDFKIAENDTRSKELLVKYEKSKALPRLNAFINGAYSGFDNRFTFLNNDKKWFGSSMVGVSLDIPIFSSLGRSAKTQRAKINYDKAKTQLTEVEQRLKLQISNALNNYEFAIDNFNTKKNNLSLAKRIEKKNQTKFFEGIASSFDLRQAQVQLYNAQQEWLQSMLNVINSKATLDTLTNTITTF